MVHAGHEARALIVFSMSGFHGPHPLFGAAETQEGGRTISRAPVVSRERRAETNEGETWDVKREKGREPTIEREGRGEKTFRMRSAECRAA